MLAEMTAAQVSEWQAYDRLEPFGEQRADIRTALLCSVVSDLVRSAVAGGKSIQLSKLENFMLDYDAEEEDEWSEEKTAEILGIFGHFG